MTEDQERKAEAALAAEQAAQDQASARLVAELAVIAAVLLGAFLRGATPGALRTLIRQLLGELVPAAGSALEVARTKGYRLGHQMAEGKGMTDQTIPDATLQKVIDTSDDRARLHLDDAVVLSTQLPMTDENDVMAVIGKAQGAVRTQKVDAAWVTHRSVALGVAEVAQQAGLNVVWVAERNACLHCLAYQGRVVAPGRPFPPGLTYADKALVQLGPLLGPPLHPHCRCQLETTDLEAGTIDAGLAREAARSVARGLTDHASEPARIRAADRLVKSATSLLPKSVLDRARRNLKDGRFKPRPDSPQAKADIVRRNQPRSVRPKVTPAPAPPTKAAIARKNQARADRGPQVRPAEPLIERAAAEALITDALPHGPVRAALLRYTGGEYHQLNGALRNGWPFPEDWREDYALIQGLFRPIPFPTTVYRGMSPTDRDFLPPVGETLVDPAPMSTSLSRSKAHNLGTRIMLIIDVPAGTPVIPVSQLQKGKQYRWGASGNEEELLLPPGTRLKIISDELIGGQRTVHAQVV